jgi:hypothetical protein
MSHVSRIAFTVAVTTVLFSSAPLFAQEGSDGSGAPAAAQAPQPAQPPRPEDLDFFTGVEQADFTVITLPTTLRLPRFKSAFRVTHRFARPLGAGDFGDLAGDLFGLDSGAQIGLEYRFGLISGTQVGIHRTSNKTIEFFGEHNLLRQAAGMPIGLAAIVTVEGTNNFRDNYSTALGAVVSRTFRPIGTFYLEPIWIDNTNPLAAALATEDDTFELGLGARIRIVRNTFVTAELVPRLGGYDPGVSHASVALEKRVGGHVFQINISNGFGTTMAQVARGGLNSDDWYLGFNISRKFF